MNLEPPMRAPRMPNRLRVLFVIFFYSICSIATSSAANVTFQCLNGWNLMGTHCYNYIDVPMDFEDAVNVCNKYGSTLLNVRDEIEAKNVSDMAAMKFANKDYYWIYNGIVGLSARNSSANSTFCEGMWQPNEPRETSDNVAVASNTKGRWSLMSIWKYLPFVCRAPACPMDKATMASTNRCNDGTCFNTKYKCDGYNDCLDSSDENDCPAYMRYYYSSSSGSIDKPTTITKGLYQWIIESPAGNILRLEITALTIQDNVDTVRVYSGGPTISTSVLIQEIRTSSTSKIIIFGKNNYLIIVLQGTTSVAAILRANWISDPELSMQQVKKITVTDKLNTISSPYFNTGMTPRSYKMEWQLEAPVGQLITVEVLNNTFDMDDNSGSDFYMVTNVGFVLKKLDTKEAIYISNTNSLSIMLKARTMNRIFNARFKTGCDFTTMLSFASFSLTNLPTNLTCSWTFMNNMNTDFRLRIENSMFTDSNDFVQISIDASKGVTKEFATLNSTNVGAKEFTSLTSQMYFKYFSDTVLPGNKISGTILADCPIIKNMNNMNVTYGNTATTGKSYAATIVCQEGYNFKQEEYRNQTLFALCNNGGMWDWGSPSYTRMPECQIVYCGFPSPIRNGFVSNLTGNVTYKAIATYQCFDGFQVQGSPNVTCEAQGNWTQSPTCEAEKCPPVPVVQNANYSVTFGNQSDLGFGTVVKYTCDAGFDLMGAQIIVCFKNKTWSHESPSCKKLTCPLPMVSHGQYNTSSMKLPEFNENAILTCDPGYQINRTKTQMDSTSTCNENRTLNVIDICVDINECDPGGGNNCTADREDCINKEGSFSCVCKKGYNGTGCSDIDECSMNICHQNCTNSPGSYNCSCEVGYNLYIENGTNGFYIPAGENGLKPGDQYQINNTCVPVMCKNDPFIPAHGKALKTNTSYAFNETVQIICEFGYQLEGSSFATCQSDGNWTFITTPVCKGQTCPQPTIGSNEESRIPSNMADIEPQKTLIILCKLNDGTGKTIVNKTLFCAPNPNNTGTFTLQGDNPICPEVNCGQPLNIPGAKQPNVAKTLYGDSFEFECDSSRGFSSTGLSSLGNLNVTCQSNGQWGYGNLICQGSRCKDPGTLAGTTQFVKTSYEIDQIVQYNCTRPGFTPSTNGTLVCEYKNNTASWSGDPPMCTDTTPPMISCPALQPFDLYSKLVYPNPDVTDNSGIKCFMLVSGMPSGVSLVSENTTVRYKASDGTNETFCEYNVTLRDYTEPAIECNTRVERTLVGEYEILNVTEALLKSHSTDGVLKFDPAGPINLTLGSTVAVRASITKTNGLAKECAFLIVATGMSCMPTSLVPPANGKIDKCTGDNSSLTCTTICDDGYLYQSQSNSTSYSCTNGVWNANLPLQPCIKLSEPTFDFDVRLLYTLSGSKIDDSAKLQYDPVTCLNRHYTLLAELVKKMNVCNSRNFSATNIIRSTEVDSMSDAITFTLQLLASDGNEATLESCATTMLNQATTLFGPTNPATSSITCLSPWSVTADNFNYIKPKGMSCGMTSKLVDYNNKKSCLPCGPGMFYDNTAMSCQKCQDGFYQDMEGQTVCKQCQNGVVKSYEPRTSSNHCQALCPPGFTSTTGYIIDKCTPCPPDQFSLNPTTCSPCPNNGSTLGVAGAKSASQCSEPCQPGQYSITGYNPCSSCPMNFYSDASTSKKCIECPTDSYTTSNGSKSISDCQTGTPLCTANFCNPSGITSSGGCKVVNHRPTCECLPGYYGDSCNTSCDACSSNPCYNDGKCLSLGGFNYNCTCKSEKTCNFERNQNITYSTSDPTISYSSVKSADECKEKCRTNDNCVAYLVERGTTCYQYKTLLPTTVPNIHESYVKNCSVRQLFDGPQCQNDSTNDCNATVCTNLDFCMDRIQGTKCQCPQDGNYDEKCAKSADPCQGINCSGHGKCIAFGTVRSVCECYPGYTGAKCEEDINQCLANINGCLYNGTCIDGNSTYSCSCPKGYTGKNCENLPDFCASNDCKVQNGGFCTNDYQTLSTICTCSINDKPEKTCIFERNQNITYTSNTTIVSTSTVSSADVCKDKCRTNDICVAYLVERGTTCYQYNTVLLSSSANIHESYVKSCNDGQYLQKPKACTKKNFCMKNPCQNGTCVDGLTGFKCNCNSGFEGVFCQHNIDNCVNQTCSNGGTCMDMVNTFRCECPVGYSGSKCENNLSDCPGGCVLSNTDGGCIDLIADYQCLCKPAFMGKNCTEDVDECLTSQPCLHGGNCTNKNGGYTCTCPVGWTGQNCETEQVYCSSNICKNMGSCLNLLDQYYCQCLDGTAGKNCEMNEPICDKFNGSICTVNGKCALVGGNAQCQCQGDSTCTFSEFKNLEYSSDQNVVTTSNNNEAQCRELCLKNVYCLAYLVDTSSICYQYKILKVGTIANKFSPFRKDCTVEPYYSGHACELERNYCGINPCNGGTCMLNSLSFMCDCSTAMNQVGKTCTESKEDCNICPTTATCRKYSDKDGRMKPACLCGAMDIVSGNMCKPVDMDFDLAFLESFASKGTFVTSERGFYLDMNTNLSIALWVAAANKLDEDKFIMALKSTNSSDPFLTLFNSKVRFFTNTIELKDSSSTKYTMSDSFYWHFISITWSSSRNVQIVYDYTTIVNTVITEVPPMNDVFFVHLGQSFYGYISQVYVWSSLLTISDSLQIYDKNGVPQSSKLLLGWTIYSYDESVQKVSPSSAAGSLSVCSITNTIAKMGLDTPECKSQTMPDKMPPEFSKCSSSVVVPTDYNKHQIVSNDLGNTVTTEPGENYTPDNQLFSYGAFDVATSYIDKAGNIGVCMTRAYATPNKCSNTEPQRYTETCKDNPNGKKVSCPADQLPSIPVPNFVSCSMLQTYNLDNMYEPPDRLVCGIKKPRALTSNLALPYTVGIGCKDSSLLSSINKAVKSKLNELNATYPGLCSNSNCDNIIVNSSCNDTKLVLAQVQISNLGEYLNSTTGGLSLTPQELMIKIITDKTPLQISNVASADLINTNPNVKTFPSCEKGFSLFDKNCVQCGPGSYYHEVEMVCKLCDQNKYTSQSGLLNCTECAAGKVTFQKGSSDIADCKDKCLQGQMYDISQSMCVDCPKNFYQDQEGKSYCFPCPISTGTEKTATKSISDCTALCPPGTELKNRTCVPCQRGYFRVGDVEGPCTQCNSVNTTRYNGSTSEAECIIPKCSPGSYVSGNTTFTCEKCSLGSYQQNEAEFECLPCKVNFTTENTGAINESFCRFICPIGQEQQPPNNNSCAPCKRGYYRSDNLSQRFQNCTMCDGGNTTLTDGSTNVTDCMIPMCMAGTYLNMTEKKCYNCPINTYQNESLQADCKICPNNTQTKAEASTSVDNCTFACPAGYEVDGSNPTNCVMCARGTYKDDSLKFEKCKNCSTDKTTDYPGAMNISMCNVARCMKGQRVSSDNQTCLVCPKGTYQEMDMPLSITNCSLCPLNTSTQSEASTNMSDCKVACQPGFGVSNGMCEACKRGSWNNGNETLKFSACQICPTNLTTDVVEKAIDIANCSIRDCRAGTYINTTINDCVSCEKGFYQNESVKTSCIKCPDNTSTNGTGSSSPNDCTISCPLGTSGETGSCVACGEDLYKNTTGFGQCLNCTGDLTSTPANRTECTQIFCDKGRGSKSGSCVDCDIGFYKDTRGNKDCTKCPVNKSTLKKQSVSAADCSVTFCESGMYLPDNITCAMCPIGTYKDKPGNENCSNCSTGFTTDGMGKNSSSDCNIKVCSKGQFRNASNECQPCNTEYYQDQEGQTNCTRCLTNYTTLQIGSVSASDCRIVCQAGYFRNDSLNNCSICPRGTYQSQQGKNECTQCTNNQTTANEGSTNSNQCYASCLQGNYRNSAGSCSPCSIGEYQDMTDQFSCKKCAPIGPYNASTFLIASKQDTDCYPVCTPGLYLNKTARSCDHCSVGSYKNQTSLDTSCQQCNNGFTTETDGGTNSANCSVTTCGRGFYREQSNSFCKKCPIGMYQDSKNAGNIFQCTPCPAGNTTLIEGAADSSYCIKNCSAGQEYRIRNRRCNLCPIRQYRPLNSSIPTCFYCPTGFTTTGRGSSNCIPDPGSVTAQPRKKISISVVATFKVTDCGNTQGILDAINQIILKLVQNQNDLYNGLCLGACDVKTTINVLNLCGVISPKKRQADQKGSFNVTVNNVDEMLTLINSTNSRSSLAVLEEAFYNTDPVQDTLDQYKLELLSFEAQGCYPQCSVDADGYPLLCDSGEKFGDSKCEVCPKGTYSTNPISENCTICPTPQTTKGEKSQDSTFCNGECAFNDSYCSKNGVCQKNTNGISFCQCNDETTGVACTQRKSAEDTNIGLVVGICVGIGCFLLLVLLIIGCFAYKKNQAKKQKARRLRDKSQGSDSDGYDYKYPMFNQAMVFADPTMYGREVVEM